MTKSWHETAKDQESESFSSAFWERHREDLASGRFWFDRIAAVREDPAARLRLALENLPLPAAFREAAIATRALIRERRRVKAPYSQELALLYWLAAVASFSVPYSDRLQGPGYNVLEATPGEVLRGLTFSYAELGYERLTLLNKTDAKWIVDAWGEPWQHTTLHVIHAATWAKYEDRAIARRARLINRTLRDSDQTGPHRLASRVEAPAVQETTTASARAALGVVLLLALLGLALIVVATI